jgi:hypothetical protein
MTKNGRNVGIAFSGQYLNALKASTHPHLAHFTKLSKNPKKVIFNQEMFESCLAYTYMNAYTYTHTHTQRKASTSIHSFIGFSKFKHSFISVSMLDWKQREEKYSNSQFAISDQTTYLSISVRCLWE